MSDHSDSSPSMQFHKKFSTTDSRYQFISFLTPPIVKPSTLPLHSTCLTTHIYVPSNGAPPSAAPRCWFWCRLGKWCHLPGLCISQIHKRLLTCPPLPCLTTFTSKVLLNWCASCAHAAILVGEAQLHRPISLHFPNS
jgi:hypothetical protein